MLPETSFQPRKSIPLYRSLKFADVYVAEMNFASFGFETDVSITGVKIIRAADNLTIYSECNRPVTAFGPVMVPLPCRFPAFFRQ